MPEWLTALLDELRAAGYPAQFHTTNERVEQLETWLQEESQRRTAEWRAAGAPEQWHEDISLMYCGPHFGPMLKGVEVLPSA
jgi:hypothetical protein